MRSIYDEAVSETIPVNTAIYNKAEKIALLEQCNYDLQAIEMKIREHTPTNTSIRRKMEPYRVLLRSIQNTETSPINLREFIA